MRTRLWLPILILLSIVLAACGATPSPVQNTSVPPQAATATPSPTEQPMQTPTTQPGGSGAPYPNQQPTQTPTTQPAPGGSTADVSMKNISFAPPEITVKVGTTVVWTNDDPTSHTVTAGTRGNPSGLFDSGNLGPGQTFRFTFDKPGTYNYYCKIHPGMDGVIVVEP